MKSQDMHNYKIPICETVMPPYCHIVGETHADDLLMSKPNKRSV